MLTIEAIGVVFLIAYTTFAALQWFTMNKTYDKIREQTDLFREQAVGTTAAVIPITANDSNIFRNGVFT